MKNLLIIFIALISTQTSCGNKKIASSESKVDTMKENKNASNFNSKWYLSKMGETEVQDKNAFLEFNKAELKFNGKAFCNSIFGRLELDDESEILFNNMGMTMMACNNMDKEKMFTDYLRNVTDYEFSEKTLMLLDKDNKLLLTFTTEEPSIQSNNEGVYNHEKTPLLRLYDIWGLKEIKGEKVDVSKGLILELNTTDMIFNGKAHCNRIFGAIASEGEGQLGFANIGATRMSCPELKSEQDYIQLLREVKSYQLKNLRLLMFNEKGELLLDYIKMD